MATLTTQRTMTGTNPDELRYVNKRDMVAIRKKVPEAKNGRWSKIRTSPSTSFLPVVMSCKPVVQS